MTSIELAPEQRENFDRILEHLEQHTGESVSERISEIIDAFDVLELNPLIGRSSSEGHRELMIGRGSRGYVALYHYVESVDTVFILSIRGGREAGYAREWLLV